MKQFEKPEVVISKCIEFDHCRYNGDIIRNELVSALKPYVNFIPVCAECEIGLGIPRDPIRIVKPAKEPFPKLFQPSTNLDFTEKMNEFSKKFLGSIKNIDGFILKAYSPSCGIKGVKIYPAGGKTASIDSGAGFFGRAACDRFGHLAVEDELRLTNLRLREHFLTKLFLLSSFRTLKKSPSMKSLVKFQADNKLLLMAYNQTKMRELGKIVANHEKLKINDVVSRYEEILYKAFSKAPSSVSNINVLMHAFGYFSDYLKSDEKVFILESFEKYRNKKLPLSVPVNIIKSLIIRFDEKYLKDQTYFEPYPESLAGLSDSGKEK